MIITGIVSSISLCVLAGQDDTNSTDQAIVRELSAIHTSLEKNASELSALRTQKPAPRDSDPPSEAKSSFVPKKANIERLRNIKLPENATKAQIGQYIREIVAASQGQNEFSPSDIQVGMLARVGSTNLQSLVDALEGPQGCGDYHLEAAICRIADSQNKDIILRVLPFHHDLVKIVTQMGWENDAKATLVAELKNKTDYLPREWITAVVALKDPTTYPVLRDYFIYGHNKEWTYYEIKDLPIEDMPAAVADAWQRSRSGDPANKLTMVMVALQFGHKDALEWVLKMLTDASPRNYDHASEIRNLVLKHVDFYGSNNEVANWYRTNRDQIKFDAVSKKFVVGK